MIPKIRLERRPFPVVYSVIDVVYNKSQILSPLPATLDGWLRSLVDQVVGKAGP